MKRYLTPDDVPQTGWNPPFSWFFLRVCSREIGRRISEHPDVLDESKRHLQKSLGKNDYHCSPRYIHQWIELLEKDPQSVVNMLCSPDDNISQVLRSVMPKPLQGLISHQEREEIRNCVVNEVKELRAQS